MVFSFNALLDPLPHPNADELAFDLDNQESLILPGENYRNRIVSSSLLVTSRLAPIGNSHLFATVRLARGKFTDPVHILVTNQLADAARIQRGCQLRIEGAPVFKGPKGYYLLATRESEVMIALCETPALPTASLSDSAPKQEGVIVFSELMTHSVENRGKDGEWVELYNPTDEPYDLIGCQLRRPKPHTPHTIAENLVVPPGGYVILSSAERPIGAKSDYVYYDDFGLLDDTGRTRAALTCGATPIDIIDFSVKRVSGRSLTVTPKKLTSRKNDALDNWCWAPTARPGANDRGDWSSPGIANEPCPPR